MSNAQKGADLIEVELSGSHIHAGKEYLAGSKIQVTKRQKLFLEQSGKVGVVTAKAERVQEA